MSQFRVIEVEVIVAAGSDQANVRPDLCHRGPVRSVMTL
jgi:hypothetical protein